MNPRQKVTKERYLEVMDALSEVVIKNRLKRPRQGGGLTMTSYPVGNKTSLSRKPCIADKKILWITIMKSWSLSHFYKKKTANINFKNLSVYKFC